MVSEVYQLFQESGEIADKRCQYCRMLDIVQLLLVLLAINQVPWPSCKAIVVEDDHLEFNMHIHWSVIET